MLNYRYCLRTYGYCVRNCRYCSRIYGYCVRNCGYRSRIYGYCSSIRRYFFTSFHRK